MQSHEFNALPQATRERFVRALTAPPPEGPLASRISPAPPVRRFVVSAALAAVALVVLAFVGFGRIATPVQDRRFLAAYVILAGVLGTCTAIALKRKREARSLPFAAGVYVMAQDIVDARTSLFTLYPLNELTSVDVVHEGSGGVYRSSILWAVFPTQSFTFEIRGRQAAEACREAILDARRKVTRAFERGERSDLSVFDPFAEVRALGFPVYHEGGGPLALPLPLWASFVWAIGLVSAFVVGVAVFRGRNAASDARAFTKLERVPDAEAALLYLNGGGTRAETLRRSVLPRARLKEALAKPGPLRAEALDQLLRDYAGSDADAEARDALARTLHEEFAAAKTAPELRALLQRWPAAADVPAARSALHGLYQAAVADLRMRGTGERNLVPVLDAVFAWEEARGEPIPVRFRRRVASSLAATDRMLDAGLLEGDGPPASGHAGAAALFADGRWPGREAVMVRALEQAFRDVFPSGVLALTAGPAVADDPTDHALERPRTPSRPVPEVSQPALVVDVEVLWNGLTYVSGGKRFLGLQLRLDLAFVVPPSKAFSFSVRAESPVAVNVPDASTDERVYDAILGRAIETSALRLGAAFFDVRTRPASGR